MSSKWIFGCLFFCLSAFSDETVPPDVSLQKGPHHSGIVSSLNLGISFSSLFQSRGVVFYPGFQIDPVLGIFFFDDRVEFLGNSIGYRDFIYKDKIRYRTQLWTITDDPLFPAKSELRRGYPDRRSSYEWSHTIEFFIPGYNENYVSQLDLFYAHDLVATHGNYLNLQGKVKLFSFRLPYLGTLIEPNLFSALGWGDAPHNLYYYGEGARHAGFTDSSYGLWLAFPEEADRTYPIIKLQRFQTLDSFSGASFARGHSEGWLFSFIATLGFL